MRLLLSCVAAFLLAPQLSAQRPIDVEHYRISVAVPPAGETISAVAELTVRVPPDSASIELDFGTLTISTLTVDGVASKHERRGETLVVDSTGHTADGVARITIAYRGKPADGLIIGKTKYGDRSLFADNWPNRAHHWFPANDHPSDKATVEFIIEAPNSMDVLANGELEAVSNLQNGRKLWHWRERVPIPVHTMVFGATEFSVLRIGEKSAVPVFFYLFPKDREAGLTEFGRADQMLAYFIETIGPYPYSKLAISESSTRFGGMENSSAIFMAEKPIDGKGTVEGVVAHEIAHQWFGDSVTQIEWHELWLSEGFATYFAALCMGHLDGREAFDAAMQRARTAYLKSFAKNPTPVIDRSITDLMKLLNANNYQKGAWVLHMLRREVGDRAFFSSIRDFYSAHRDRNATTRDLQRHFERRAGRELGWFFDQWIFGPGYPILQVRHEWSEPDKQLKLTIEQRQNPAMQFLVDVELTTTDGTKQRIQLRATKAGETFMIPLDSAPSTVIIDPDESLLKEIAK